MADRRDTSARELHRSHWLGTDKGKMLMIADWNVGKVRYTSAADVSTYESLGAESEGMILD